MATTTNTAAAIAQHNSLFGLTTTLQNLLTADGGSDFSVSTRTGGLLRPDQIANLRLRNLWTFSEAFTIANALGKAITYTVA